VPFADFGMAISETESASAIVVDGGFIDPTGGFGGIGHERTVVDAELVFIDEDKGQRGAGLGEIGFLVEIFTSGGVGDREVPTVDGREPAIHGHAADMRKGGAKEIDAALIGGAFVNVDVVDVRIDQAELNPFEAGVAGGSDVIGAEVGSDVLAAGAPLGVGAAGLAGGVSEAGRLVVVVAIGDKAVLIVPGIHFPSEGQLAFIGEALDALGFLFGPGQRGQQHGGQDGDDGDDDQ
jgi:hypothetical protein